MKKWKFTEKENKGAQEALGRDGGNESSSGEPSWIPWTVIRSIPAVC